MKPLALAADRESVRVRERARERLHRMHLCMQKRGGKIEREREREREREIERENERFVP